LDAKILLDTIITEVRIYNLKNVKNYMPKKLSTKNGMKKFEVFFHFYYYVQKFPAYNIFE